MRLHKPTRGGPRATEWRDGCLFVEEQIEWPGLLLAVHGELDLAALPQLREHLERARAAGGQRIVLDLSDVSFIDSLSLSALVAAKRKLGGDGRMAVVAQHPYVLLIFEAGGLDSVFELFWTREEAVAYVNG